MLPFQGGSAFPALPCGWRPASWVVVLSPSALVGGAGYSSFFWVVMLVFLFDAFVKVPDSKTGRGQKIPKLRESMNCIFWAGGFCQALTSMRALACHCSSVSPSSASPMHQLLVGTCSTSPWPPRSDSFGRPSCDGASSLPLCRSSSTALPTHCLLLQRGSSPCPSCQASRALCCQSGQARRCILARARGLFFPPVSTISELQSLREELQIGPTIPKGSVRKLFSMVRLSGSKPCCDAAMSSPCVVTTQPSLCTNVIGTASTVVAPFLTSVSFTISVELPVIPRWARASWRVNVHQLFDLCVR